MNSSKPCFIVGPHRSGTTLLYEILGRHPDIGYYNRQNRHTPNWPRLAAWHTRLGATDRPMEAQNIWDRFWDGNDDRMDESDATKRVRGWFGVRIPGRDELTDLPAEMIAGRIFRIVTREIEGQRSRFGERYVPIRYEFDRV